MTYDEGRDLIAQMQKEHNITNWSNVDLAQYLDLKYEEYVRFGKHENYVKLDGYFCIPELEAILLALYNERGAPKG